MKSWMNISCWLVQHPKKTEKSPWNIMNIYAIVHLLENTWLTLINHHQISSNHIFSWWNHIFLWFSYGFPMVFLWFSHGFPMVFPWFSHGFHRKNRLGDDRGWPASPRSRLTTASCTSSFSSSIGLRVSNQRRFVARTRIQWANGILDDFSRTM